MADEGAEAETPESAPLTLIVPERFQDTHYAVSYDKDAWANKKYRSLSITLGKTRHEIFLDESLSPSAVSLFQTTLQAFARFVPKAIRDDKEGERKPMRIAVVDRSPLLMQVTESGTLVVNKLYFDFLEWLNSDTQKPFEKISLADDGKTIQGLTGKQVDKEKVSAIFHALTMTLFYHWTIHELSTKDFSRLADQWPTKLLDWRNRSVHGSEFLRDLWEVWGSYLSNPQQVERLYMPNAAMISKTYAALMDNRSGDLRRGFNDTLKETLTGYANVGEITERIELEQQRGHQLLLEHPEFATAYAGRGSASFSSRAKPSIPDRTEGNTTWRSLYQESEYRLGTILAMQDVLISQSRLGDERYHQKDQFKFWSPLEQLVSRPHRSSTTRRLVNLFHLLNVARWGEDAQIPSEESLYDTKRHPHHRAMYAELKKLDFNKGMDLLIQKFGHELAVGTWKTVMREKTGQDEEATVLETFRRLTKVKKPVRKDLEKFIDHLYRTYPKENIHEAALQSVTAHEMDSGHVLKKFLGDEASWRHDPRYRPYHAIYAGDSHVLFAQWLGDFGLRREIQATGYLLPSLYPILATDGPIDPNMYNGMQSINIKPLYFDEEFMEIISQKDPELLDKFIVLLEEKSVAEEGSHYEPRQENVPGKQWGRVYKERLNYLFLIKKHYPRIFAVLVRRKPALADSVIDLNRERIPEIALQEKFAFSDFSWDKPHFYMQALNVFGFLTIDDDGRIAVTQPHLAHWQNREEEIPVASPTVAAKAPPAHPMPHIKTERGKGSPAALLRQWKSLKKKDREKSYTIKEMQKKMRDFSEKTVRLELEMLVRVGLVEVDKSVRAFRYSLKEVFLRATPDRQTWICDLPELNKYEIPIQRQRGVRKKVQHALAQTARSKRVRKKPVTWADSESILRKVLKEADLRYIGFGGAMNVYQDSKTALIVKIPKPGHYGHLWLAQSILRERGGGLAARSAVLDSVELTLPGLGKVTRVVQVMEPVVVLGQRILENHEGRGADRMRNMQDLIDAYFDLQEQLWSVGIYDPHVRIFNYGVNAVGNVRMMDQEMAGDREYSLPEIHDFMQKTYESDFSALRRCCGFEIADYYAARFHQTMTIDNFQRLWNSNLNGRKQLEPPIPGWYARIFLKEESVSEPMADGSLFGYLFGQWLTSQSL